MTALRGIRFGVHAGLQDTSTDELAAVWRRVENAGFEWISVWDHFYAAAFSDSTACLEGLTTHAALALRTSRVRCGSLVYSAMFRHPAVLAKSIATIDQLSGGRCDVGIGAGWYAPEAEAFGLPFPTLSERFDRLEEAVQVLRLLLHEKVASFEGRFFTLREAEVMPRPIQDRLPIWIGGGGERRTLPLAARYADGWNLSFVPPEVYAAKRQLLLERCDEVGRDPEEIRCSLNVGLAWSEERLLVEFGANADDVRAGVLVGSENEVLDRVHAYIDAGADDINISMRAPFDVDSVERFADLVLR